jgi:hypothetical protein
MILVGKHNTGRQTYRYLQTSCSWPGILCMCRETYYRYTDVIQVGRPHTSSQTLYRKEDIIKVARRPVVQVAGYCKYTLPGITGRQHTGSKT